ncbi:MAG: recombinase family protein [Actinomycetota bacterium]|nr:recombinase family protein [Actinomycetota bacterium]
MTTTETTPRALIYTRKSSDTGDRGALSLEVQAERCRERATLEGLTTVLVFDEGQGVSASKSLVHSDPSSRPALADLLSEVRPGDVVISWEVSRLGRNEVDAGTTLRVILQKGGHVLTLDGTDTRQGDQLGFGLRALLYAEESRRLSERVKAGKARSRAAGRFLGGYTPYGWHRTEAGTLEVDETERAVALRIAADAMAGKSWRSIGETLTSEGVPSRSGVPWSSTSVSRVVRAAHGETLLGRELWLRLKAVRPVNTRAGVGGRTHHLTGGPVRCGRCGRTMAHDKTGTPTMRCSGMAGRLCQGVSVAAGPLDRTLGRLVVSYVRTADPVELRALAVALGSAQDPGPVALAESLRGELAEITEKVEAIGREVAAGRVDVGFLGVLTGPLVARKTAIEATLADLGPTTEADPSALVAWASDAETPEEVDEAWLALDPEFRREVLLIVWPSGVGIAPGVRGARFTPDRLMV